MFGKKKPQLHEQINRYAHLICEHLHKEIRSCTGTDGNPVEIVIFGLWVPYNAAASKFGTSKVQDQLKTVQLHVTGVLIATHDRLGIWPQDLSTNEKVMYVGSLIEEANMSYISAAQKASSNAEPMWGYIAGEFVRRVRSKTMDNSDVNKLIDSISHLSQVWYTNALSEFK